MNSGDQSKLNKKGFSGLSSFVSKIDVPAPLPEKKADLETPTVSPKQRSSSVNESTVVVTIVILVGLIILAAWLQSIIDSSRDAISPSTRAAVATPTLTNTYQATLPPEPKVPPPAPTFTESRPSPGYGQSLSENEIRYCLAENIRLDAESGVISKLEKSVNLYRQSEVDRFNMAVNAYNARAEDLNSRCSHYRYYQSAMARAKADVEQRRSVLVEEGRERVLGKAPQATASSHQNSRNASEKKPTETKSASSISSTLTTVHVYKCKMDNGKVQYTIRPTDKIKCQELSSN